MHTVIYIYLKLQQNIVLLILFVVNEQVQTDLEQIFIIITKTIFKIILKATLTSRWIISIDKNDLEPFSNEPIKVLGKLATSVTQNEWTCEDARLSVVDCGHKNIIGRVTFKSLGLAVVQQQ